MEQSELQAIVDFVDAETARRRERFENEGAMMKAMFRPGHLNFLHLLADVQFAALAVMDGIGTEEELQALLDEADYLPLYRCGVTQ